MDKRTQAIQQEKLTLQPIKGYRVRELNFSKSSSHSGFAHNYSNDFHMFALWEKSRPQWPKIIDDIKTNFKLIAEYEIHWRPEFVKANFERLYGSPVSQKQHSQSPKLDMGKRADLVGSGPFILLVVEDLRPHYVFHKTYSQKIELVNRNIIEAKARYRDLTDGSLYIHSSNSIREFFRDASLILGHERVEELVSPDYAHPIERIVLKRDLSGTEGWTSLHHLFAHLRYTADYVVLRNFSSLPDSLETGDRDLDILCADADDFAAVSGTFVTVSHGAKLTGVSRVAGQEVQVDIRYVGDGYYDRLWQEEMLRTSIIRNSSVFVLTPENHFFSLLYHAKIHKRSVKDKYVPELDALAREIGISPPPGASIVGDECSVSFLAGFLYERAYDRSTPLDVWVEFNTPFARKLDASSLLWSRNEKRTIIALRSFFDRMPLLWRVKGKTFRLISRSLRYARSRFYEG